MRTLVYLAGPSRELRRVRAYAEALESSAYVSITHKWWEGFRPDSGLDREAQLEAAKACMNGIIAADIMWVLWPRFTSDGTPFEFGFAAGLGTCSPRIVVSGPGARCIFTAIAPFRDPSDDVAMLEVLRLAKEFAGCRAKAAGLELES